MSRIERLEGRRLLASTPGLELESGVLTPRSDPTISGTNPRINIVKLTNGTDNNAPTGPVVPVGSTVTFTYVVTNPGDETLSNVVVRDDNGTSATPADDFNPTFVGGDTDGDGLLDLSETWTFTASRIATAGQYSNVGTATAVSLSGTPVSDSDVDHHFGSVGGVNLVKLTNGTDNNSAPGPTVPVGSTVTFTYVVTNPGNVPLASVFVTDDNGTPGSAADDFNATFVGGDTNANGLLDETETWTFTASQIATPGQYSNVGRVTATSPFGGGTVSDSDVDFHFGGPPLGTGAVTLVQDPCDKHETALNIEGTAAGDTIAVTQVGPGQGSVNVVINGFNHGTFSYGGSLLIYGQGGNDLINVDPAVTRTALVFAGAGNDVVNAGGGNDVLLGEAGTDQLRGNAGSDILIGGLDSDDLNGGAQDDILISGTTAHDSSPADLCQLSEEWTRKQKNYNARLAHIQHGKVKLTSGTVFGSPSSSDAMTGGDGRDLFFATVPPGDVLNDRTPDETVVDVG
jgi:uncharacterized repeat protein (TIGR01451 family)